MRAHSHKHTHPAKRIADVEFSRTAARDESFHDAFGLLEARAVAFEHDKLLDRGEKLQGLAVLLRLQVALEFRSSVVSIEN